MGFFFNVKSSFEWLYVVFNIYRGVIIIDLLLRIIKVKFYDLINWFCL